MKKICVIDDNGPIRKLFCTILKKDGYELYDFANGETALKELTVVKPDLIIMDILLPDINGTELIGKVKSLDGFADVPVVAVTGFASEEDAIKLKEIGFIRYLSKPVNTTVLSEEVKKLLG